MRVLLTGGSGFLAAHVLHYLLERGHSVVTTVRSLEKGRMIKQSHSQYGKDRLDFAIVEDVAKPGAFDDAVRSDPPFGAVIHTASPFHFNVTDVQKQLLDPAIIGTTGILESIKRNAPTVERVILTSSIAAVLDHSKGTRPGYTYSEADWNPITREEAVKNPSSGYRGSKTLAERAAWEFVQREKPNFTLSAMCPGLVLGPMVNNLNSLDSTNTSNQRARDCMQGKWKDEIPQTGLHFWVDVRDAAMCHVLAAETESAANERFLVVAGRFCNRDIAKAISKDFPQFGHQPTSGTPGGDFPEDGLFEVNSTRAAKLLGEKWRSFDSAISDTVKTLQAVGA